MVYCAIYSTLTRFIKFRVRNLHITSTQYSANTLHQRIFSREAIPSQYFPVGGTACSSTKGGLLRYILNTYSIHKISSSKFAYYKHSIFRQYVAPTYFFKGGYPVTVLPPPRRPAPSLGLGTTWVRQLRSGSCHHPTAATKCNGYPVTQDKISCILYNLHTGNFYFSKWLNCVESTLNNCGFSEYWIHQKNKSLAL